MSKNAVTFLTPVGRLVQGDPFEAQTEDYYGKPLTVQSGANAGQPAVRYFVALAIPKNAAGVNELIATIWAEAKRGFPTMFDAAGKCLRPDFAFKYVDGDSVVPDQKGTRPCDREGFAGNWVFRMTSGFAIKCYDSACAIITNPDAIKRGYFVRVNGSVAAGSDTGKPGVYLNPSMLQLVAFGEEITSGPDAAEVFGAAPLGALPAGASATPSAPASAPAGMGAPLPPVTPAHDFLTPAAGGAVPPPPTDDTPPPPASVSFVVPGAKRPYTEAELLKSGWKPEQIAKLARA